MTLDVSRLDGQLCKLYIYQRGYLPRDILYLAWRSMEDEGATAKVFHAYLHEQGEPFPLRGDLAQFCEYFSPLQNRHLLICQAKVDDSIAGLLWFDDVVPDWRASANLYFRRKFYGSVAHEAGRMALTFAFQALGVKHVWAMTPWREPAAYARRLGFKLSASLKDYALINEKPVDMTILHLSDEDFVNGR